MVLFGQMEKNVLAFYSTCLHFSRCLLGRWAGTVSQPPQRGPRAVGSSQR